MLGRLDRLQGLLRPACQKEASRDFGGDFRHFSGFFVVLLNEAVDVAQGVGDFR
jgi:hypothetical protein